MNVDALNEACRYFGSQRKLAIRLGIHSPAISSWRQSRCIPPMQCRAIELATGGKITRQDLDPVLFGPITPTDIMPSASNG